MSVPGPPPANAETQIEGAGVPYVLWTSVYTKANKDYYQETLAQQADLMASRTSRWEALILLRALTLIHGNQPVQHADVKALQTSRLGRLCKAVMRAGRLSEVGVRIGVQRIIANPEHIDIDWYGDPPLGHWWNGALVGRSAEECATLRLLNFLEDSFGIAQTPENANPATWQWPPDGTGNTTRPNWTTALTDEAPEILPEYQSVVFEWHEGAKPGGFDCDWQTNQGVATFRYWTPRAQGPDPV